MRKLIGFFFIYFAVSISTVARADYQRYMPCGHLLEGDVGYEGRELTLKDRRAQKSLLAYFYRAKVHKHRIADEQGAPITLPKATGHLGQFVVTKNQQFLISKNMDLVDHAILGQGKPVMFAGIIGVNQGRVSSLTILPTSAYKASPENLARFAQWLQSWDIDLSDTLVNIIYERHGTINSEKNMSVDELTQRFGDPRSNMYNMYLSRVANF